MTSPNITMTPNACPVLDDFLRTSKDPRGIRRAVAVRAVASGQSRTAVVEAHGVTPNALRKWIRRFAHEGVSGLLDAYSNLGSPRKYTAEQEARLVRLVGEDPHRYGLARRRWTLTTLSAELFRQTGLRVSDQTIYRLLVKHPRTPHSPRKRRPSGPRQ